MLMSALAFIGLGVAQALGLAVVFYALAIGARNTMQPLFQPLLLDSLTEAHLTIWPAAWAWRCGTMGWFGATLGFGWLQLSLGYRGIMAAGGGLRAVEWAERSADGAAKRLNLEPKRCATRWDPVTFLLSYIS